MSVEEADSVAEALCASVVRCFGSTTILAGTPLNPEIPALNSKQSISVCVLAPVT